MKKLKYILLLTFGFLLVQAPAALAQCAMCRAQAESSLKQGKSTIAAGLNTGILYLMIIPYMAFTIVGVLWYRASKKNKQEQLARMARRAAGRTPAPGV